MSISNENSPNNSSRMKWGAFNNDDNKHIIQ